MTATETDPRRAPILTARQQADEVGTSEALDLVRQMEDPATDAVVMHGEIGGVLEEMAAPYIKEMDKPVVSFIAGRVHNDPARFGGGEIGQPLLQKRGAVVGADGGAQA